MSYRAEIHDTEERAEDAIVAYLKSVLPGTVYVGPKNAGTAYQQPCALVGHDESDNVNPTGRVTGHLAIRGHIEARTNAAPETLDGVQVATARDARSQLKAAIRGALMVTETGVDDAGAAASVLNAYANGRVAFSMFRLLNTINGEDNELRALTTRLNWIAIAHPVEG